MVIYSKDNCPWCDRAKELMTAKGERYMEPEFGTDIRLVLFENITTEEEFQEKLKLIKRELELSNTELNDEPDIETLPPVVAIATNPTT